MKIYLHSVVLAIFAGAVLAIPLTPIKETGETLIAMETTGSIVKVPVETTDDQPRSETVSQDTDKKVNVQIEIPVPLEVSVTKTQIPVTVTVETTPEIKSTVVQIPVGPEPIETSEGNAVVPGPAEIKKLSKSDIVVEVKTSGTVGNTEKIQTADVPHKFSVKHPFNKLKSEEKTVEQLPVVLMMMKEEIPMQLPEVPVIMNVPETKVIVQLPETPVIMQLPELPVMQLPAIPPVMQLPETPAVPLPETPIIMQIPEIVANELKKFEIDDPVANLVASQDTKKDTHKKFVVKNPFKPLKDEKEVPETKHSEITGEILSDEAKVPETETPVVVETPTVKTPETPEVKVAGTPTKFVVKHPFKDLTEEVKAETAEVPKEKEVVVEIPAVKTPETPEVKLPETEARTPTKFVVKHPFKSLEEAKPETPKEVVVETPAVKTPETPEVKVPEAENPAKFVVKHPFKDLTPEADVAKPETPIVVKVVLVETPTVKSPETLEVTPVLPETPEVKVPEPEGRTPTKEVELPKPETPVVVETPTVKSPETPAVKSPETLEVKVPETPAVVETPEVKVPETQERTPTKVVATEPAEEPKPETPAVKTPEKTEEKLPETPAVKTPEKAEEKLPETEVKTPTTDPFKSLTSEVKAEIVAEVHKIENAVKEVATPLEIPVAAAPLESVAPKSQSKTESQPSISVVIPIISNTNQLTTNPIEHETKTTVTITKEQVQPDTAKTEDEKVQITNHNLSNGKLDTNQSVLITSTGTESTTTKPNIFKDVRAKYTRSPKSRPRSSSKPRSNTTTKRTSKFRPKSGRHSRTTTTTTTPVPETLDDTNITMEVDGQ